MLIAELNVPSSTPRVLCLVSVRCVLIETSACSTKTAETKAARIPFGRASVMNSYENDTTTRTRPITARLSLDARGTFARAVEHACTIR